MNRPHVFLLLAALVLTGCFGSKYESQLEETGRWYAYLDKLNDHLGDPWKDGNFTYLRPPQGFTPQYDPNADTEEPVPLVPDFVESDLEGLRGVFVKDVPTADGKKKAYLFAADNYELWVTPTRKSPHPALGFVERFGRSFRRQFEPVDLTSTRVVMPKSGSFGTIRRFDVSPPTELGTPIDGTTYDAILAEYDTNDVQGVVVLLMPADATNRTSLQTGFEVALEALELRDRAPKPGVKKDAGSGSNRGTGGGAPVGSGGSVPDF